MPPCEQLSAKPTTKTSTKREPPKETSTNVLTLRIATALKHRESLLSTRHQQSPSVEPTPTSKTPTTSCEWPSTDRRLPHEIVVGNVDSEYEIVVGNVDSEYEIVDRNVG